MKEQSIGECEANPWINDQLDKFRRYLRAEKRSENTVERYRNILRYFLVWLDREPGNLTKADMMAYKSYLAEKGYCENSMSVMIAGINCYILNILERTDLHMRPPKKKDKAIVVLTVLEVETILSTARKRSLRDHAGISLMYYGAMRISEVSDMRISDIDFVGKKAIIRRGKGGNDRTVNLSEYAVHWIREYIEKERPKPIHPEDLDRLFLSVSGKALPRNQLWRIVKEVSFEAGITKRVYPHLFRHSLATHMAEQDVPATKIREQTGHKSLDMLERYLHMSVKAVRESYDEGVTANPDRKPVEPLNNAQERRIGSRDGIVNYVYSFSLGTM